MLSGRFDRFGDQALASNVRGGGLVHVDAIHIPFSPLLSFLSWRE